jgi:4-hydroxy-2-oxoheptanedioate aldolase
MSAADVTPVNAFKAGLRGSTPQVGLWVGLADSVCVEIAAGSGYDWLLLDGEHSPFDLASTLIALQVIAAYPTHPIVRVREASPALLKKVLDIGAQSVLVPAVESAEQARLMIQSVRYPPAGIRGVGTGLARAARWNRRTDYFARADAEMCVIAQIETRRGLDALDDIVQVEGLDAIFIGPSDLAASLGHLGNPGHPDVQAVIADAIRRVRAAGLGCGSLTADPATAQRYVSLGCNFVGVGSDTVLLESALRKARTSLLEAPVQSVANTQSGAAY